MTNTCAIAVNRNTACIDVPMLGAPNNSHIAGETSHESTSDAVIANIVKSMGLIIVFTLRLIMM